MTVVAAQREPLVLADGVELIGEYEGSGFKEPPLLARRSDGQVVQLSPLLYDVAAACDGRRDEAAVAEVVAERSGQPVSARNVSFLVEQRLRPAGVVALPDGTTPELPKREALLALRHRRPILSERVVNAVAGAFAWLHRPAIQLLVLAAIAVFDVWLLGIHGIAGGLRSVLYEPELLLGVLAAIIAATILHEFGHASACRYAGARPGVMGIGVYLVWPAFYCDVTDAYRLDRAGRLRTDLGGVYFNGIFMLLAGGAYFATGEEALLLAAFLQNVIALQQLLPLLRFDGYYVLSDLTGVPDILSRIKPIFRSLVRGRRREPQVDELKPWVRVVVTAYLLLLVPALMLLVAWMVVAAPRMLATAFDSLTLQLDELHGDAGAAELGVAAFRVAALVLPLAAIALSLGRSARLAARGVVGWARGSVLRGAVALAAAAFALAFACTAWWPDDDYTPIRPDERGTVGEAVERMPEIASAAADGRIAETESAVKEREPRGARGEPARSPGATPEGESATTPEEGEPLPESFWEPADDAPADEDATTPAPPPPTASPAPTPSTTAEPTPTDTPTPTATPTPTPTATPTPTPAESEAPSTSSVETPDASTTPSPEPTPTP